MTLETVNSLLCIMDNALFGEENEEISPFVRNYSAVLFAAQKMLKEETENIQRIFKALHEEAGKEGESHHG